MKRIYVFTVLGILLVGLTVFFLQSDNPETALNKGNKEQTDTEKHPEPAAPGQETQSANDIAENEQTEPIEKFTNIIGDALQQAIDFFIDRKTHIVAIGDSLTQGVGDGVVDGGYVGILKKKINENGEKRVMIDNYGKRGIETGQLLKRLEKPEITKSIKDADIILITIGANDIMQIVKENFTSLTIKDFKQERSAYKQRLKHIFNRIRNLNSDAEVYLIGFYNPFAKYFKNLEELGIIIENWNNASKTVTKQYEHIQFIPTADLFAGKDTDLFAADNFHPNHRGYQLIAKRVLQYITK